MTWYVYGIVPEGEQSPIYIGMTSDRRTRVIAHGTSGPVATWMQEIGVERECEFVEYARCESREEAAAKEGELIRRWSASLLNRAQLGGGRAKLEERHLAVEAQKPWEALGMSRRTWYRRQAEKKNAPG